MLWMVFWQISCHLAVLQPISTSYRLDVLFQVFARADRRVRAVLMTTCHWHSPRSARCCAVKHERNDPLACSAACRCCTACSETTSTGATAPDAVGTRPPGRLGAAANAWRCYGCIRPARLSCVAGRGQPPGVSEPRLQATLRRSVSQRIHFLNFGLQTAPSLTVCSLLLQVRSLASLEPCTVTFKNEHDRVVRVLWINYSGGEAGLATHGTVFAGQPNAVLGTASSCKTSIKVRWIPYWPCTVVMGRSLTPASLLRRPCTCCCRRGAVCLHPSRWLVER